MSHRRWPALLLMSGLALAACGPDSKPAGTSADPVDVCEKSAQVCRYEGAKLGVCTHQTDGRLVCTSQH